MIFYFSGTGNTRYVAERVSEEIRSEAIDIRQWLPALTSIPTTLPQRWGIAFPVYGWGIPPIVERFIDCLPQNQDKHHYVFSILTCGDEVGKTHEQLRQLLSRKGYTLQLIWSVQMPNTYVCFPFFDVDSPQTENLKLAIADQQVQRIARAILFGEERVEVEQGSVPTLRSGLLHRVFYRWFVSPRLFRTENRCTGCNRCVKVCPMKNIVVSSTHVGPRWGNACTFCMACYHICPIQNIYALPSGRKKGQTRHFL